MSNTCVKILILLTYTLTIHQHVCTFTDQTTINIWQYHCKRRLLEDHEYICVPFVQPTSRHFIWFYSRRLCFGCNSKFWMFLLQFGNIITYKKRRTEKRNTYKIAHTFSRLKQSVCRRFRRILTNRPSKGEITRQIPRARSVRVRFYECSSGPNN